MLKRYARLGIFIAIDLCSYLVITKLLGVGDVLAAFVVLSTNLNAHRVISER